MMVSVRRDRRGIGSSDAMVVLSLLALAFAIVLPRVTSRAHQQDVEALLSHVDTLRTTALAYREAEGSWPADAPMGAVPAELAPSFNEDFALEREGYALDWNLWETVHEPEIDPREDVVRSINPAVGAQPPVVEEEPEVPRTSLEALAGISVHTDNEVMLATLLHSYGAERSFVHGTVWTLILTEGR